MSFGLTLAGGGLVGLAWEAGYLTGLLAEGVDVTGADTVIGTSAGSIIGSMLLSGRAREMAEYLAGPRTPMKISGKPMNDGDPAANLEVLGYWSAAQYMDQPTAAAIADAAARSLTMTEAAWVELFAEVLADTNWPARLQVVAVSAAGERTTFTAADGFPLYLAVAASSAVPGMFPPVRLGDQFYVDGGLWSATSADLLIGPGVRHALLLSPLGGKADWSGEFADRATTRELAQLEAAGIAGHWLTPAVPVSPLGAFDGRQRIPGYERGLAEGKAAAGTLSALVA